MGTHPPHPHPRFGQAVHVGGLPFLLSPLLGRTAGHRDGGGSGQSRPGPGPRKAVWEDGVQLPHELPKQTRPGSGLWPPGSLASGPAADPPLWVEMHGLPLLTSVLGLSQPATERPHPAGAVQPSRDPPPGLCCRLCFHRWWGRPAAFASLCLWELRPPGNWPRRSSGEGPPRPKGPQLCCFPRNLGR